MNNNICQFYVILGNKHYIEPTDNNVYINATNIKDVKELSKIIIDTYKEKAKSSIKVGSEIIFLIPNEKYKNKTEEIIKELQVNGKVEIMESNPIEKEEIKNETEEVTVQEKVKTIEEENKEIPKEELNNDEVKEEPIKSEKVSVYKKETNVYKGTPYDLKKKKQNNIPAIIIFIVSLIFFIISLILLFFM